MKRIEETSDRNASYPTRSAHRALSGRQGRWSALVILALLGMFVLCLAEAAISAETHRPKGKGTLTTVRDDGMAIIEESGTGEDGSPAVQERGYRLSPHVLVLDSRGKKTSLEKLMLPAVVRFEYLYTPNGPEIRLIRELGQ